MSDFQGILCSNCFASLDGGSACPRCGYDNDAPQLETENALKPFSVVGERYLLGRVLGAGGFGITYIALDVASNKQCAVKEYYPSQLSARDANGTTVFPRQNSVEYQNGLNRFFEEANVLHTLRESPYVVRIEDFVRENGTAYMIMEYLDGENLKTVARAYEGRVPYDLAYSCFLYTALALSTAHTKQILHGDVSPENILLMPQGETKLIDFGAARAYMRASSGGGTVVLKPGFAPPEQYSSKGNQGPWTDIYALACTFYRIVTGVPVPDATERRKGAAVPAMHTLQPEVPIHVSLAVERAMALDIPERYANMDQFIAQISAYDQRSVTKSAISKEICGEKQPYTPAGSVGLLERLRDWFRQLKCPVVTVVSGPNTGASLRLTSGKPVRIGRMEQTCELVPGSDLRISRIHCILTYHDGTHSVTLEDTSRNGTLLENGYKVRKGETYLLRSTTVLQLASTECMVKVVIK